MMARKLAGLFTVLALIAYFGAWLLYRFINNDPDTIIMNTEQAWQAKYPL